MLDARRNRRKLHEAAANVDFQPLPGTVGLVLSSLPIDVRLLDEDPDLAQVVPPSELGIARRALRLRGLALEPGPWDGVPVGGDGSAALLVKGLIARDLTLGGRLGTTLLGPGDLIPSRRPDQPELLRSEVRWTVVEPARIALLGLQFDSAARRWPQLASELMRRSADQASRSAAHQAIAQLPRVEDRVAELLLLLAERWGRMAPEGLILPLRLTHAALGRLVGSRRPTVSLALKTLAQDGRVRQRSDGAWVLRAVEGPGRSGPVPSGRMLGNRPHAARPAAENDLRERGEALRSTVERLQATHRRHRVATPELHARCAATRARSLALCPH